MPLDELSRFVSLNNHLPDMTINKPGPINIGLGIQELLVKVEEQALYLLELHGRLKNVEMSIQ